MKFIAIILVLSIVSCSKTEDLLIQNAESASDFKCLNETANSNFYKDKVQGILTGTWQLKYVATMLPSTTVDDLTLTFTNDGKVTLKGVTEGSGSYILEEKTENNYTYVTLNSIGNINMAQGQIRICQEELLIDQGMALDAPGYFFRRVK
ncbi:MAG: hypothetical protein ACRCVT_13085 [Leadbetterella sp.]